ncbi:hypothetical protein DFP72DRAFT_1076140 [Ephemerocybe angulata]|uniref:Uncharacterized protein n=1 Tax=Ephemerocybe angulata TaxID=980116 RepID=A0A8H6HGY9_9AGAR|nr:hypothetical protein DFP72DRAFT_1076140 [Tulosesus angulatus]
MPAVTDSADYNPRTRESRVAALSSPPPPPAPRADIPGYRSLSPPPSRRSTRSSRRLPARYKDYEADPKSGIPSARASEGEVNESDATDTRDNDYESSGRSSSTTDSGAEDIEGSAAGLGKRKVQGKPHVSSERATTPLSIGGGRSRDDTSARRAAGTTGHDRDRSDEEEGEEEGGRGRQPDEGEDDDEDEEDEGPRPDKGKGRARRSEDEEEGRRRGGTPTRQGQRARSSKSQPKPGAPRGVRPLTAEDRAELEALQAMVVSMGERMGRTPRAVLEEAGFRIALGGRTIPSNIFEQWLVIQPSTPSLSRAEFVQYAAEQYHGIASASGGRGLPGSGEGSRGAVREMEQIGRQLEDLCRRLKLTTDVDLVCLLTSQNPVARQMASVYSSSESLRTLVDNQEVYVRDLIERFTTAMQTLDLGMVDPERINLQGLFGGGADARSIDQQRRLRELCSARNSEQQ